jgi:hypothetical protein
MCFGGAKAISNVEASGPKKVPFLEHLFPTFFFPSLFLLNCFKGTYLLLLINLVDKLIKSLCRYNLRYIELQTLKQVISQVPLESMYKIQSSNIILCSHVFQSANRYFVHFVHQISESRWFLSSKSPQVVVLQPGLQHLKTTALNVFVIDVKRL